MKPGDQVKYRSLCGELYDATIIAVRTDGSVDIDVAIPGTAHRVTLTHMRSGRCLGQVVE